MAMGWDTVMANGHHNPIPPPAAQPRPGEQKAKTPKCGRNGAATATKKNTNFATGKRGGKKRKKQPKNPTQPQSPPSPSNPPQKCEGDNKTHMGAAEAPARSAQRSASHPGVRSRGVTARPHGRRAPRRPQHSARQRGTGGGGGGEKGSDGVSGSCADMGSSAGTAVGPASPRCAVRSGAEPGGRKGGDMGPGSPSAGNGGVWIWGGTRSASRGEFGLYGIANKEKRRGGKKK